jgi:hypothetical protein
LLFFWGNIINLKKNSLFLCEVPICLGGDCSLNSTESSCPYISGQYPVCEFGLFSGNSAFLNATSRLSYVLRCKGNNCQFGEKWKQRKNKMLLFRFFQLKFLNKCQALPPIITIQFFSVHHDLCFYVKGDFCM